MSIHVGHAGLKGDFQRYAKRFDFVELSADPGRMPKRARLREWREQAPEGFRFALCLPSDVCALGETPEVLRHLERFLGDAEALDAMWLVVRTPASVRPGAQSERKLGRLIAACGDQRRIAWEPAGLWDPETAAPLAEQLKIHLVRDPLRVPVPVAPAAHYLRVRALGVSSRLSTGAAEAIADVVSELEDAHIAVEGGAAGRVRRALADILGDSSNDDEDLDDLDDGEDDDEPESSDD